MNLPERLRQSFHSAPEPLHVTSILILGILAYVNSFAVPMHFDDFDVLRKTVGGVSGLSAGIGPRLFTDVTFALNRLVHGEAVAGYHAVNLAIHLAAAVCLYVLVRVSIKAVVSSYGLVDSDAQRTLLRFTPFTVAALFVCHPVQTQAVTYISQRYTSLAACLYLASMLSYVRCRGAGNGRAAGAWGAASFITALLAMTSKETAFTLPVMIGVLEIGLFRGRLLKRPLYLMLMAALLLVIPLQLLHISEMKDVGDLLNGFQRATSEAHTISRSDYLLTQARVIVKYLRLMIMPVNQNLDYDFPLFHSIAAPQVAASLLLHLALMSAAVVLFVRSQRRFESGAAAAGISMRLMSLGIVWFYVTLAVESSIIPIRDVINEHRLYLPSGGFLLTAVSIPGWLYVRKPAARKAVRIVTGICCLALACGSIARNRVWGSEIGIWQDVLRKSPGKARAHYNAGHYYSRRAMPDKALPHLVRAIELAPEEEICWTTLQSAIALLDVFSGRSTGDADYQAMTASGDPRFRQTWQAINHNNLGLAYEYSGNLHLARRNYERAVMVKPDFERAWFNLAVVAARQQNRSGFEAALSRLRELDPLLAQTAVAIRFVPRDRVR